MQDIAALIDTLDATHDDDPAAAGAMLHQLELAAVPAAQRARVAFLINHVLGEKLKDWPAANARQHELLDAARAEDEFPPGLWRQAGAAALLAGDVCAVGEAEYELVRGASVGLPLASATLRLTALMYVVTQAPRERLVAGLHAAFDALPEPLRGSALDAALGACGNNIASALLDRGDVAEFPALLWRAARLSRNAWARAGTWVHHERSECLLAMVGNATGEFEAAREHALTAAALIAANGTENVDLAFIELERAAACHALDRNNEAKQAHASARVLADRFEDAGLKAWFEQRERRLGLVD